MYKSNHVIYKPIHIILNGEQMPIQVTVLILVIWYQNVL